ncbi:DUF350 domain-containing protein [Anaerolineae bacterium CFX7]|nr:DUF350 domain-containing protein [Anaerolineae bacterium CFX7]
MIYKRCGAILTAQMRKIISVSFIPQEAYTMGNFWQGGLPPLPGAGPDFGSILLNMVFAIVWAIVAAIGFALAIGVGYIVLNKLTPGLNEWEELKKGNLAVALLWSAFTLAVAIVLYVVLNK